MTIVCANRWAVDTAASSNLAIGSNAASPIRAKPNDVMQVHLSRPPANHACSRVRCFDVFTISTGVNPVADQCRDCAAKRLDL